MENMLGNALQIILLAGAVFFALLVCSALLNLYLRFHDRLSIDREDVQKLAKNAGVALVLVALAKMFRELPFFTAMSIVLCCIVAYQILKINGYITLLDRKFREN